MSLTDLQFMNLAKSAYNSAAVRLTNPDTDMAAMRILSQFPNIDEARQAIAQDISPSLG
jgi:hypothetical protein